MIKGTEVEEVVFKDWQAQRTTKERLRGQWGQTAPL